MKFEMKNKTYDVIKFIITILLPAADTLFNGLVIAWGWKLPVEAINATIGAIIAFFGAILGISNAYYKANKE